MANVKKKNNNTIGIIFLVLQVLASVVFVVLLMNINVLPNRYVIVIGAVLLALAIVALIMHLSKSGRVVGVVYSIVIAIILILGSIYLWKTNSALDDVTTAPAETTSVTSRVTILTKVDSSLEGLQDLEGQKLGVQEMLDQAKMKQTLTELQPHFTSEIQTVKYSSYIAAVDGLYAGDVGAIVFNEAFRDMVKETYPNFDSETEALTEFNYKEIVKTPETVKEESSNTKIEKDVSNPSFIVYLSGNDGYGEVTIDSGRSDVNILLVANPETRKILLLTTPRDSYVWMPRFDAYDKLTHSGIYGLDVPMETLEYLYGIDIDYYVRINFSGFEDIVDALGGVTVYCDESFSTFDGKYFEEGNVTLNGADALSFVRERYNVTGGDLGRGRHQMAVINGMIDKATSSAILTNYIPLMDSLSSAFMTDMPKNKIAELVKMQLDDNTPWEITSFEVLGEGNMRSTCYSTWGADASVIDLYDESVEDAKEMIQKIIDGK